MAFLIFNQIWTKVVVFSVKEKIIFTILKVVQTVNLHLRIIVPILGYCA